METEAVVEVAARIMAPYLGENMARASAWGQLQKLGTKGGEMTREQAESLLGKLATGLNVFVGRERSSAIVAQIREALAEMESR
jgi:hypothetical protein